MLALRDKGIDSLFSTLASILPPLVASGMLAHQASCLALAFNLLSSASTPCLASLLYLLEGHAHCMQHRMGVAVLCLVLQTCSNSWVMQYPMKQQA